MPQVTENPKFVACHIPDIIRTAAKFKALHEIEGGNYLSIPNFKYGLAKQRHNMIALIILSMP